MLSGSIRVVWDSVVREYGDRWDSVMCYQGVWGQVVLCLVREYGDRWDSVMSCQGVCRQGE